MFFSFKILLIFYYVSYFYFGIFGAGTRPAPTKKYTPHVIGEREGMLALGQSNLILWVEVYLFSFWGICSQ
jgi:hypothetical protein